MKRLGADSVCAVDPSATFLDSVRARFPDLDVQSASAEQLPFPDDSFDHAMAQLVVHFMQDPVAGLAEMRRVSRTGGCARHLVDIAEAAGLTGVEDTMLSVVVNFPSFEDWWEPYTLGVGRAGAHVAALGPAQRVALRDRCSELLPRGSFDVSATAWAVRGRAWAVRGRA